MNRIKPNAVSWRQRLMPLRLSWRKWWPGMLLVAAAGLGWQQLDAAMAVRAWQVYCDDDRLQRALSMRLQKMAPIGFVAGTPAVVGQRLRMLEPDVATIEVERVLPHRLRVHATARQPVALWTGGAGQVMLVDGAGTVYRTLHRGERLDLPLLRVADQQQVRPLAHLLEHLKRSRPQRIESVSELIASDGLLRINLARGGQWQFPLDGELVSRVDHIMSLLDAPRWRHGEWKVDARQQDRWFVRAGNSDREVI